MIDYNIIPTYEYEVDSFWLIVDKISPLFSVNMKIRKVKSEYAIILKRLIFVVVLT